MAHTAIPNPVPLAGSSGRLHSFEVSRWTAAQADTPGVYALLSRHGGRLSEGPTVLYVGESENLESAISRHREYPCMDTFVDAVATLPAGSATERAGIRRDLVSFHAPPCESCWPLIPTGPEAANLCPDWVAGGCVVQRELLDERLGEAMRRKRVIRFVYERRQHEVEPREYGVQADGRAVLLAYSTRLGVGGGQHPAWAAFRLSEIQGLVITDRSWGGARPAVDSPIAVAFAQSEVLAVRTTDEAAAGGSPEAVTELRRQVEEAVQRLRTQVLDLRRLEAHGARLEYQLDLLHAPAELSEALHAVRAEQARVEKSLLALIPEVGTLQRRLPTRSGEG